MPRAVRGARQRAPRHPFGAAAGPDDALASSAITPTGFGLGPVPEEGFFDRGIFGEELRLDTGVGSPFLKKDLAAVMPMLGMSQAPNGTMNTGAMAYPSKDVAMAMGLGPPMVEACDSVGPRDWIDSLASTFASR